MPNSARTLLTALAVAALCGCGQFGPLYLPQEDPANSAPASPSQVTTPADA